MGHLLSTLRHHAPLPPAQTSDRPHHFKTKMSLWMTVLVACLSVSAVYSQGCSDLCNMACQQSPLCVDIPPLVDCAQLAGACNGICKANCGCFGECVQSCSVDREGCEGMLEQIPVPVPGTFKSIGCDNIEMACSAICMSSCPVKVASGMAKAML